MSITIGSTVHIQSKLGNSIHGTTLSYVDGIIELEIVHPMGSNFERRTIKLDISDAAEYPYVEVIEPVARKLFEKGATNPINWAKQHQNQHSKRFTFFDNSELIHYTSRKSVAWGNGKAVVEEKQAA